MALANAEVRWTFARLTCGSQKFAFIAAPFFDIGRPFDSARPISSLSRLAAVVRRRAADLVEPRDARHRRLRPLAEDTGLYINFGHIF